VGVSRLLRASWCAPHAAVRRVSAMLGKEESAVPFPYKTSRHKLPATNFPPRIPSLTLPQNVLEEMFVEADADKDGRIRRVGARARSRRALTALYSEEEFLRILQRDVQKKF
jgi:hypothetical protein